ncbi:MAG: hypothetical protein K8H84_12340 [Sulfuricella denitrificans]|nr:hypothetical protein [Sulfuricella denitrificans]
MSARPWLRWGKRAFFFASVGVIVFTAISDDGGTAQTKRVGAPLHARAAERPQPAPDALHVELERMNRPQLQQQEGESGSSNVFSATSWYVPPPPPPPAKPAPPPKPTAPPLPFSYLGRYQDAALVIMLVKGDRVYTVSEGDVIENTYRVERVSAGMVELTYLPLNIRQTLSTGAAS